ncbi:MAG: hypothetical protein ING51_12430 [Rhodocyclaceae bacterium]|nr:hypothetical protein [Rhodocyclaceae bacterium]
MAVIDSGSDSAGKANVDAAFNLKTTLPQVTTPAGVVAPQYVGAARMFCENDPGTIKGTATLKSPEVSQDYRLRVGTDTVLLVDTFNATAQNTGNWSYTFNTLTAAQPGAGTVNFSTVQGTTSAHGAFMRTFQYFPLFGTAPLSVEFTFGQFTAALVTNENWLMGLGLPTAATTEPTDGAWVRLTTAGLIGEIRFSGSTTQSGVLRTLGQLTVGNLDKLAMVVGERNIEYWLDDVLLDTLDIPAGNGQPFQTTALPAFMMKYNTGAVSNTNTMRVSDLTVCILDVATSMPLAHQMAMGGKMAYQGQNGGTMGTTALLPNATAATVVTGAALSQTVPIAVGLGGQAGIVAAVPGVDGLVTSFQVPTGGINQTPRNLVITGIRIDAVNIGAAVATTASILQWSLAYGATGATVPTLAQAESASFATGTTKAWRRIPLGVQSWVVGAAIGASAEQITMPFASPVVVRPGEWVASVAKFIVGTATASQVEWATVTFDAHYV